MYFLFNIFALSPFLSILELYVLGDDAMISRMYFMQTKHLCVLIHILSKGKVSALL